MPCKLNFTEYPRSRNKLSYLNGVPDTQTILPANCTTAVGVPQTLQGTGTGDNLPVFLSWSLVGTGNERKQGIRRSQ